MLKKLRRLPYKILHFTEEITLLQPMQVLRGKSPCSIGFLMRNSAVWWTSWTEPDGVSTLWHSQAGEGSEIGMAAGPGMLQERWLLSNTPTRIFLSAVKISGLWNCGLVKTASGLTLQSIWQALINGWDIMRFLRDADSLHAQQNG